MVENERDLHPPSADKAGGGVEPKKKLLIFAAIAGGFLFLYGPGLIRWAELKAHEARLKAEITSLKSENQRLYLETRRLREDPAYVEALYRQQLGVARPGETVIRFKEREETARR